MKAIQMKELIQNGENVRVGFIATKEELTKIGPETVISFLNTSGGLLILGVNHDKKIIGVSPENVTELKLSFQNGVNNITPSFPLTLKEIYIDGKLLLYVYVPESSEVHLLQNERIFHRVLDKNKDITDNSHFVKKLYCNKSGKRTEDIVFPDLEYEDFNEETITQYKKSVSIRSGNPTIGKITNEELIKQPIFYKQDIETGELGYTLATLLLFGKKEMIVAKLPYYKVDVVANIDRHEDRLICEENLIDSYNILINFIQRKISHPFFYDNKHNVTIDVTSIITRELVSNILIHRDFLNNGPVKITIYKDKVIAENPNLSNNLTELPIDEFEPYSKNPIIAKTFRSLGYADELGSGFKVISDMCSQYFESVPTISDEEQFSIEIPLISIQQEKENNIDYKNTIIDYINKNNRITNKEARNILNCEKTKAGQLLSEMTEDGVLNRHGSGPSTYYDIKN